MLDLVTQKKHTEHAIAVNDAEIAKLKVELEVYVIAQKRYNDLATKNQYLQAIANNLDLLLGEDALTPVEDPWAPLSDK